jgi:hypothetical protein
LLGQKTGRNVLVRYFVSGLLEVVRSPVSIVFVRSFGALLKAPKCVDAVRTQYFVAASRPPDIVQGPSLQWWCQAGVGRCVADIVPAHNLSNRARVIWIRSRSRFLYIFIYQTTLEIHPSACCLRLLYMQPYVHSLGRCWDPRHYSICSYTTLPLGPELVRQWRPNSCHRTGLILLGYE